MVPVESKKKLRKSFKTICNDWLSSITCHGFPRVLLHESRLMCALWAVFPTLMALLAFYFIIETVSAFLSYDVVTNIKTYDDLKTLFPTISICNQNPFVTDFAVNYVEKLMAGLGFEMKVANDIMFIRLLIQSIVISENDELKKKMAYERNETILNCHYNGIPCADDDFSWYYDFYYGNCYKFNAGKTKGLKISNQPGSLNGLEFEYFLGGRELKFPIISTSGLRIFVHNHTEHPMPSQGLDILPSQSTSIALKKTITERLGYPYNECIKNLRKPDDYGSMFYKTILSMNVSYTKSCCMDGCFQNEVAKNCKCFYGQFPRPNTMFNYCKSNDEIICVLNRSELYYGASSFPSYCDYQCPQECDSEKYSTTLSASKFPTDYYAELLFNSEKLKNTTNYTVQDLKNEMALIKVYIDELKYTLIYQLPKMDIASLISGIGGNLGLFLGLSICSFMELFEFFWILIAWIL